MGVSPSDIENAARQIRRSEAQAKVHDLRENVAKGKYDAVTDLIADPDYQSKKKGFADQIANGTPEQRIEAERHLKLLEQRKAEQRGDMDETMAKTKLGASSVEEFLATRNDDVLVGQKTDFYQVMRDAWKNDGTMKPEDLLATSMNEIGGPTGTAMKGLGLNTKRTVNPKIVELAFQGKSKAEAGQIAADLYRKHPELIPEGSRIDPKNPDPEQSRRLLQGDLLTRSGTSVDGVRTTAQLLNGDPKKTFDPDKPPSENPTGAARTRIDDALMVANTTQEFGRGNKGLIDLGENLVANTQTGDRADSSHADFKDFVAKNRANLEKQPPDKALWRDFERYQTLMNGDADAHGKRTETVANTGAEIASAIVQIGVTATGQPILGTIAGVATKTLVKSMLLGSQQSEASINEDISSGVTEIAATYGTSLAQKAMPVLKNALDLDAITLKTTMEQLQDGNLDGSTPLGKALNELPRSLALQILGKAVDKGGETVAAKVGNTKRNVSVGSIDREVDLQEVGVNTTKKLTEAGAKNLPTKPAEEEPAKKP